MTYVAGHRLLSIEYMILFKEHLRECLECALLVIGADEVGDIVVAASVANHTHGDILECLACLGLETSVLVAEIAHDAHDTHVALDAYHTVFLEVVLDVCQVGCVVNGATYPYLAGADHVNAGLVGLEYLEHLAEEPMG